MTAEATFKTWVHGKNEQTCCNTWTIWFDKAKFWDGGAQTFASSLVWVLPLISGARLHRTSWQFVSGASGPFLDVQKLHTDGRCVMWLCCILLTGCWAVSWPAERKRKWNHNRSHIIFIYYTLQWTWLVGWLVPLLLTWMLNMCPTTREADPGHTGHHNMFKTQTTSAYPQRLCVSSCMWREWRRRWAAAAAPLPRLLWPKRCSSVPQENLQAEDVSWSFITCATHPQTLKIHHSVSYRFKTECSFWSKFER